MKALKLILFTTLVFSLHEPTLCIDPSFEACEPQSCGTGPTVSFPFWISNAQPSFCGYPNFKLSCDRQRNPIIRISNDDYVVKEIFYANHSFLATNADVYDEEERCPVPRHNLSLEGTPFGLRSHHLNLSFFYNCSAMPSGYALPFRVDCLAGGGGRSSFATFHVAALRRANYSVASCGSTVDVPADVASDVEFERLLGMSYADILRMGFVLNWTSFGCAGCRKTGGRCGFKGNEFACFCSDGPHERTCHEGKNVKLKIGIASAGAVFGAMIVIVFVLVYCVRRKRVEKSSSTLLSRSSEISSSMDDAEKGGSIHGSIRVFSYEELVEATNNFDSTKELGDGGFGTVYHGKLKDGRSVAVKRLYENNYRRVEQFVNEAKILASVRHENLVSLYGCTSRHCRELLLVYEYVPNGTVADHLHGPRARPGGLTWPARLSIAIDTAAALTYLHRSEIVHRDVKTTNILLDSHFRVKVADFGLSRLFPTEATHVSTAPQGTPGYVDPDYHLCYQLTSKSDVFSFGVVLVELISSMPAVDITRHRHDINLSTMALNRIQNHALHELVDSSLGFKEDPRAQRSITAVAELAFRCLQQEKDMRPSMDDVWEELNANHEREYVPAAETVAVPVPAAASGDDAGAVLLKNGPLTLSPDSLTLSWGSGRSTTPKSSS